METIKNYIENMFIHLPKTKEILKVKNELLSNLEEKYHELKLNGKTENEAVGIVISEFGNIDELLKELGVETKRINNDCPLINDKEAQDFLEAKSKTGIIVGIGVFLCILGGASIILINQLIEDGFIVGLPEEVDSIIGLVPLFILVAIAVGLFIYSDTFTRKFQYINSEFLLTENVKSNLEQRREAFHPTYTLSTITGVVLCILSPIILFVSSVISEEASVYGVVGLLIVVGIAVFIFIYFGSIDEGYKKLLHVDDVGKRAKVKESKLERAVAAIVWPLAVCVFLITGLLYNLWHINWIIFPVTGILFGMFTGAYNIMKEKDE